MTIDQPSSIQEQLERAAADLWSTIVESGEDFVVFYDHRGMQTRVERQPDERFAVSWEMDAEAWVRHDEPFENLREAAFHGFQGPH
jgi:uncharacterized protein (DUF1697 family)